MEYLINGNRYSYSYKELKAHYLGIVSLSDEMFLKSIARVLHVACMICFIKELDDALSDEGIMHQLIHLIHIPDEPILNLKEIRDQFKNDCLLT